MYRASTAYAALTASLEMHAEPAEPKASKRTYGLEALDSAELSSQLNLLQQSMAMESRRLETASKLQSALESQSNALSPLQAQMYHDVAQRIGLKMAHERYGFGLESYSGLRGRTLLRASTEGFKDWFKAFLERLVKLWKQLVAWVKTFFNYRFAKLREIRKTLNSGYQRTMLKGYRQHQGKSDIVIDEFVDENGKLNVRGLVDNTINVFNAVCASDYLAKVQSYGQVCMATASKLMEAEGNSWRRLVDDVKGVQFPIPEGFHEKDVKGNAASYTTDFMVGRVRIKIETGRGEQMQGHRGMGEYTDALAASSSLVYMRDPPEADTNYRFEKHPVEDYDRIVKLIDIAIASESRVRPFLKSSDDTLRAIEAMERKTLGEEADKPQLSLASKLLASVQKSDKAAANMLDALLGLAINAGVGAQHLKIREVV